jgi:hypothetical protein
MAQLPWPMLYGHRRWPVRPHGVRNSSALGDMSIGVWVEEGMPTVMPKSIPTTISGVNLSKPMTIVNRWASGFDQGNHRIVA